MKNASVLKCVVVLCCTLFTELLNCGPELTRTELTTTGGTNVDSSIGCVSKHGDSPYFCH